MVMTVGVVLSVASAAAACPPQSVHVASLTSFVVCERLGSINGSITFITKDGSRSPIVLHKRVYEQATTPSWGGFTRDNVTGAPDDVIGNNFLANGQEPDYAAVLQALPPITTGWGAKQQFGYAGQHSFTGSRNGTVDIVLDHLGDAGEWGGYPRPPNVLADEYAAAKKHVYEGLVGGGIPVLHWVYVVNASVRWEMTCAPSPNLDGNHEQAAMWRFIRVVTDADVPVLSTVKVFDTCESWHQTRPTQSRAQTGPTQSHTQTLLSATHEWTAYQSTADHWNTNHDGLRPR
eukprot:946615-Prymnesium_polylepis.2